MLLLGGALLAVAWILQQIIDIASGDSVAPLVRMCWLCLGVLVSVTTIYVVQCYTYPAFLRRAMKQYKEYAFTELTKFFAASSRDVKGAECRKADGLERIARLAPQVGLKGTPHIVTDKGVAFSGYQPAQELLRSLQGS